MPRELVVLGSASQVPTRTRNHNGYLLRWDVGTTLFDPGEGTQRQMLFAGISASSITRLCITHFHGDHCLGLPGVLQRMSLDGVFRQVPVAFPAAGADYFARLRRASIFEDRLDLLAIPVETPADGSLVTVSTDPLSATTLFAARLAHGVETVGWRLQEDRKRTMLTDRLSRAGIAGPDVGRLQREGELVVDGRRITLDEVSVERPGQSVAFVMDTGWCDGALTLAADADLLVCEATFSDREAHLAAKWGHLTARQAGRLAEEARVHRLLITHFSQRHRDTGLLVAEAQAEFGGEVVAAADLGRTAVPPRRPAGELP